MRRVCPSTMACTRSNRESMFQSAHRGMKYAYTTKARRKMRSVPIRPGSVAPGSTASDFFGVGSQGKRVGGAPTCRQCAVHGGHAEHDHAVPYECIGKA